MGSLLVSTSTDATDGQSLDPTLSDIGRLVGLLKPGPTDGSFVLNSAWFDNPVSATQTGVRHNADQLTDLLERLLGSLGGNALGVPSTDPALLGTWIPIPNPENDYKPSNLYVVSSKQGEVTVFGFGAKVSWTSTPSSKNPDSAENGIKGPASVMVEAWALLPLLKIDPVNGVSCALTTAGSPLSIGIAIEGQDKGESAPIISAGTAPNSFAFNGIKCSADIDLANGPSIDVSLVVLSLQLPGQAAADRSLADLEALTAAEIMQVAATLFVTALSDLSDEAGATASYLLPVLGLSEFVPGLETQLPLLPWYDIAAQAIAGKSVTAPFVNWFTIVASDPELTKTWLYSVSGLLGISSLSPTTVTGTGTRTDPFLTPLISAGTLPGALFLSVSSFVDQSGLRHFYPGVIFQATPIALGGSAVLAIQAAVELAEFKLFASQPIQYTGPSSLRLATTLSLRNTDAEKPLFAGTIGADTYSFGSFVAGLTLDAGGSIAPLCQLVAIVSPVGDFDVLDLTSPGQIASTAKDELLSLIQSGLKQLLGITGKDDVPFAAHLASLIGVIVPPGAPSWPDTVPQPPFSAQQIASSISNPVAALASYYEALLSSTVQINGQSVFTYLLTELATLFQQSGANIAVTISGDGTAESPWEAVLSHAGTALPAILTAYVASPAVGVTRLFLGLELGPTFTLPGGIVCQPLASIQFLNLDLPAPASSSGIAAQWLPEVSLALNLPSGFQTPPIANSFFTVSSTSLSAGWSRFDGWHWSLVAIAPAFTINGTKLPFKSDLNWGDQTSLQNLVLQSAENFAPVLVGAAGVGLVSTSTRVGTTLAGVLGLLSDLTTASNFPPALQSAWKAATLTPLTLTSLQAPWSDLLAKLTNDFSSGPNAQAVLGLLGWCLNPGQAAPPTVDGSGTADTPWRIVIGDTEFEAVVSYQAANSLLGLGLGRTDQFAPAATLSVEVQTTLSALQFSLATGTLDATAAPSLRFTTTLSNPKGNLVQFGTSGTLAYFSVGQLTLGFELTFSPASGQLSFDPVVDLIQAQLPGQNAPADYTFDQLATLATNLAQGYQTALNQAVQTVVSAFLPGDETQPVFGALPSTQTFQTAYALLSDLGLALAVPAGATTGYGINPGGWQALAANPLGYIITQLETLLTDPTKRTAFFQFISDLLDVPLPTLPEPVLQTLSALGLLGDESLGYPVQLSAVLQFAQNPFGALRAWFDGLFPAPDFTPSAEAQALITALNASLVSTPFGKYFTFQANEGARIQISIAEDTAIAIGDLVEISGAISFDLVRKALGAEISLYNPFVRLALAPSFTYTLGGAFSPELDLVWGDGSVPGATPLTLYPFDPDSFLKQLADLAPGYVLSTVVAPVIENTLLSKYPLAQVIFEGLGLAQLDPTTQQLRMRSLLGLLQDPLGWLLSADVLGNASGQFDLGSLQKILARIPTVQIPSLALGIKAYSSGVQNGIAVYGFPYGFGIVVSTDGTTVADILIQTQNLPIAGGVGKVEMLQAGLSLGPTFQPGILGDLRISGTVDTFTLFAEAAYDKSFTFTIGQEQTQGAALSIQLVPFLGWGTLVSQLAPVAAAALVNTLVPQLLTALKNQGSPTLTSFITRLQTAATDLQVSALLSNLVAIPIPQLSAETIEMVVLTWLLDRFNATNAPSTAAAVVALVNNLLPGNLAQGTGSSAGLVTYQPAPSLPITLYLGVDDPDQNQNPQLGLWIGVGVPASALLVASVERTGVGFPVAQLTKGPSAIFRFGVNLFVPIEGEIGPSLQLAFDAETNRFVGTFDPLFNSAADQGSQNSPLAGQLFPTFFLSDSQAVETWLLGVVKNVLPRYVSVIVLNTDAVKGWLQAPLISSSADSPTAALLLLGAQLIQNEGTAEAPIYVLTPFDQLAKLTPDLFFGGLLYALMQKEIKVLSWGDPKKHTEGGLWIGPEKGTTDNLGVRVAAPGLVLDAIPNLTLQLGADDGDTWIEKASKTPTTLEAGLSFYVPNRTAGATYQPDFTSVSLNLVNVGLDYVGKGGKPLVDFTRFQLGGISPRVLFSLAFDHGSPSVLFGGAFSLNQVALSLAPNQESSTANPVAQSLLGSGSSDSNKDNPPANPSFTLQAAYVDQLYVALLDGAGNPAPEIWFPVQRAFGPLYVNEIGVGWEPTPPYFDLMFSGKVALAGFEVDLVGLKIGLPASSDITDFSKYKLSLQGFDLSFESGPVSIQGGFLKTDTNGIIEYTGAAVVKAASFSLFAVGSYAAVPTDPPNPKPTATSLFIFGALSAPLGGIPAFFITGVAAGFSYNRGLKLPSISEVQDFPLVKGVVEGSFQSGSDEDVKNALAEIASVVYPEVGQYWLAAGLKFTSFSMLDGFALLFVEFGRSLEIALLGVASLPMPKSSTPDNALAYAELAIKIVINPTIGLVSVEAQLTPNSFVIEKACKLTGGFAFFLWYKDQTQGDDKIAAGDFVVSLGGYSSAFQKPAHYPDVPRLGFSWPLVFDVGSVSVGGGAYFALTPSAVMAGGYLNAVFEAGPLRAWFNATANFYTGWAPFYYVIDIGIDVGVSFGTTIAGVSVTLKVSLGADLHLEGPPTWGSVQINWYIISFTIPFGTGPKADTATLEWPDFSKQFLPQPPSNSAKVAAPQTPVGLFAAAPNDSSTQEVIKLQAETGLVSSDQNSWTFNAEPFILRVDTSIPIDQPSVTNPGAPSLAPGPKVGIQPMNKSTVGTPLTLSLVNVAGVPVDLSLSPLRFDTLTNAAPQGTWGSKPFDRSVTPDGAAMLINGTLKSVRMIGDQCLSISTVGPFELANLKYTENDTDPLPFASQLPFNPHPRYQPSAPIGGQDQALATMMQSIMADQVVALRNQVFQTLQGFSTTAPLDPDLSVMASSADLVVQAPPVLAHLGVFLASSVVLGQSQPRAKPPKGVARGPAKPIELRLDGVLRRHRAGGVVTARWSDTSRPASRSVAKRSQNTAVLYDGSLFHWSGPITHVTRSGDLPVRLTCFDQNDEVLADLYEPFETKIALPPGTRALSTHGLGETRSTKVSAGWIQGDEVLKVTSRYYVGQGFSLRPQAFVYQHRNRRPLLKGLVDIATLNEANQLTAGKPGAWETLFSGAMRSAAVLVGRGTSAEEIAVAVDFRSQPNALRDYRRIAPSAALERENDVIYFHGPTEAPKKESPEIFSVWTKPLKKTGAILGVVASSFDPLAFKSHWGTGSRFWTAGDVDEHSSARITVATDQAVSSPS